MAKHRRDEYQYPCAVIRGNERTLLGKADMNKVLEAMRELYLVRLI